MMVEGKCKIEDGIKFCGDQRYLREKIKQLVFR